MKKRLLTALVILMGIGAFQAQAAGIPSVNSVITVCREVVDEPFLAAYSGWGFNGDELILTFKGLAWGDLTSTWWTGEAISGTGVGDLTVWAVDGAAAAGYWDGEQYIIAEGNADTPYCGELFEGDAPSVPIAMTSDCAFVEIRDDYGNWHRVESDGEPVLLHYGESLIAGRSQSLDTEDYRAVGTPCFE